MDIRVIGAGCMAWYRNAVVVTASASASASSVNEVRCHISPSFVTSVGLHVVD